MKGVRWSVLALASGKSGEGEREPLGEFKADAFRFLDECRDRIGFLEQQCQQVTIAHVSAAQPDDLGWDAAREGEFVEIHVLGHDGQVIQLRVLPYLQIGSAIKTGSPGLSRSRETCRELIEKAERKILIEQQLHAERGIRTIRCSRSAA